MNPEMQPYWNKLTEVSVIDDCIVWGNCLLIPEPGQQDVLSEFDGGHPGTSRMKMLVRTSAWWPHMDTEIEKKLFSIAVSASKFNPHL